MMSHKSRYTQDANKISADFIFSQTDLHYSRDIQGTYVDALQLNQNINGAYKSTKYSKTLKFPNDYSITFNSTQLNCFMYSEVN